MNTHQTVIVFSKTAASLIPVAEDVVAFFREKGCQTHYERIEDTLIIIEITKGHIFPTEAHEDLILLVRLRDMPEGTRITGQIKALGEGEAPLPAHLVELLDDSSEKLDDLAVRVAERSLKQQPDRPPEVVLAEGTEEPPSEILQKESPQPAQSMVARMVVTTTDGVTETIPESSPEALSETIESVTAEITHAVEMQESAHQHE